MTPEDTTQATALIAKAGSVGILLPDRPNFDMLASAQALASALTAQGKTIGLLTPAAAIAREHNTIFANILEPAQPLKEFIISISTVGAPISQLRYEKHEDRVDIILTPKASPLSAAAVSFQQGAVHSDCLVMIGIQRIDEIPGFNTFAPDFFTEHAIVNIDNDLTNARYGEANCVDSERLSRSELVWQILAQEPLWTPDAKSATLLLAGILSASSSFTDPRTSAQTLQTTTDLLRAGARYEDARALIQDQQPLNLLQLVSRASVRSKLDEDAGILWSFLTLEDFIKTNRTADDAPLVMSSLQRMIPNPATRALLWQESGEASVHAMIHANPLTVEAIRNQESGEITNHCLKLTKTFPSFRLAEEYIHSLLQKVL